MQQPNMNPPVEEEGCCICLTDAVDVPEWSLMKCGVEGNRHRVCSPCYSRLATDNSKVLRHTRTNGVEKFEDGMRVAECPVCRTLQDPSIAAYKNKCRELHTRVGNIPRPAPPPAPPAYAAAGGGGRATDLYRNHRMPHARGGRATEILEEANAHLANAPEVIRYTQLRMLKYASHRQFYKRREELADLENMMGGLVAGEDMEAAQERVETAVELMQDANNDEEMARGDLSDRHSAFVELFVPRPEQIFHRSEMYRQQEIRVVEERRAAGAALIVEAQANRVRVDAAHAVRQQQRGDNRRELAVLRMNTRRDNMINAHGMEAWDRQRETCWTALCGRPCETAQKTRRMCDHEGCIKKVCMRCRTCGEGH